MNRSVDHDPITLTPDVLSKLPHQLENGHERGVPVVLYIKNRFHILYNGELRLLRDENFATIQRYKADLEGIPEPVIDTDNLTQQQFVSLQQLLKVMAQALHAMDVMEAEITKDVDDESSRTNVHGQQASKRARTEATGAD